MFYVPLKTLQRTDILVGQVVNTSFLGWLKLILCTVMYAVIFNLISSIVDRYMFAQCYRMFNLRHFREGILLEILMVLMNFNPKKITILASFIRKILKRQKFKNWWFWL